MADAIVTAVFNSTIGWLLNEGRDIAAKKLKEGDAVDQWLCNLIARELDDIKSTLKGLAQKDLGASISFYNEGLKILSHEAKTEVDGVRRKRTHKFDVTAKSLSADVEAFSLASKTTLSPKVKDRFKDARKQATEAFNDTALSPTDRIFAMYIRVKATLLEEIDDPVGALLLCKLYLEEMYSMKEVEKNFNLDVKRGFLPKYWLKEDKRGKLISSVCHVSRIVFDVVQLVGGDRVLQEFFIWPTINHGKEEIDPLRDPRLRETLQNQDMGHCSVIWSFGQEGEKEQHRLKLPCSIATNSQGQFLVVDVTATKVFHSSGKFVYSLCLATDDKFESVTVDIDTDRNDNLYLLVSMANEGYKRQKDFWYEVYVFDKDGNLCFIFPLRKKSKGRKLTVNSTRDGMSDEVLILEGDADLNSQVEVYQTSGKFVCHFGERILQDAQDIAGANFGRTLVLDRCHETKTKYVREFSAEREPLRSILVAPYSVAIAFHRASEHIVIESAPFDFKKGGYRERLSLYKAPDPNNNDVGGKLVRIIELDVLGISLNQSLIMTTSGRIAVVLAQDFRGDPQGTVIIV